MQEPLRKVMGTPKAVESMLIYKSMLNRMVIGPFLLRCILLSTKLIRPSTQLVS